MGDVERPRHREGACAKDEFDYVRERPIGRFGKTKDRSYEIEGSMASIVFQEPTMLPDRETRFRSLSTTCRPLIKFYYL